MYRKDGLELLKLSEQADAKEQAEAVNRFIDDWQSGNLETASFEMGNTAAALGIVWGDAVCREFGWEWIQIRYGEDSWYIVSPEDRAYACYPMNDIKRLMDNADSDNCALLVFNMIQAGELPPSQANNYLELAFG